MWLLLVALIAGIAYGYMAAGKQDKSRLFFKGLLIGVVVAVVVALLGWMFNMNPLGLADQGMLSIILSAALIALAFIVGVWLGDLFEHRRTPGGRGMRRV
jgi:uncharacterized membrane protein YadS